MDINIVIERLEALAKNMGYDSCGYRPHDDYDEGRESGYETGKDAAKDELEDEIAILRRMAAVSDEELVSKAVQLNAYNEAGVDQRDYRWSKMHELGWFLRDFGMAESTIDATKDPAKLTYVLTERGRALLPGSKTIRDNGGCFT